jgi:hypothetical protein
MDEFKKALGQFCINREFDVHEYRTKSKFEVKCKLEYNNGYKVNIPCPSHIAARKIPSGETIRVVRSELQLTSLFPSFHSVL